MTSVDRKTGVVRPREAVGDREVGGGADSSDHESGGAVPFRGAAAGSGEGRWVSVCGGWVVGCEVTGSVIIGWRAPGPGCLVRSRRPRTLHPSMPRRTIR